jgi:polygalacturonase
MKKYGILILLLFVAATAGARDYTASLFGIQSNGTTNNTASIQKAIDFISAHGGGTLVFYVGRYLTGSVMLKTGVYIRLEEGAVLVGTPSPYDYRKSPGTEALIVAVGQSGVGVSGKGVVEGAGSTLADNTRGQMKAGYLAEDITPALIAFKNCTNVSVAGLHLWYGPYAALTLTGCRNVSVEDVDVNGKDISTSMGIVASGCSWVTMTGMFIQVARKPVTASENQHLSIERSVTAAGKVLPAS